MYFFILLSSKNFANEFVFTHPGKTVFVCKVFIEVRVLVRKLTISKSGSGEFAKIICAEVFNEHSYFYEQPLCTSTLLSS